MRGRHRASLKVAAAAIALVALASGCNSKLLRPPAIVFVDSGEFAVATSVREEGRRFPSVFLAFMPSQVPLHPGDALNFQLRDTGEPHTVAMGTLIDAAVEATESLGPTATLGTIEGLAAMKRVPSVLPSALRDGMPVLNASAAERCFLSVERPPVSVSGDAPACPQAEQPEFDGTQTFFSSGVLEEGEPFRVKIADGTQPGTYRFMCLVHRSAMTGAVEIRPKETERPPVSVLRTQAEAEQDEIASTLEPSAREAATAGEDAAAEGGPVAAAAGPAGLSRGFLSAFFGREVKAKVGERVRWDIHRTHTISFRPSRDAREGFVISDGDGVRINEDVWEPVGSEGPPPTLFRVPPSKEPFTIDGGTWSGEGSWSSGVLRATPPAEVSYTMRFSQAGTYAYTCLVHDSMRGSIVVE